MSETAKQVGTPPVPRRDIFDLFGKWTTLIFGVIGSAVLATCIIAIFYMTESTSPLNQPVTYGTPPPAEYYENLPPAGEPISQMNRPDETEAKELLTAVYSDLLPGSNEEWLNWAWTSATNTCDRLDGGETLTEIRATIPQDEYFNNAKMVTQQAILTVCPDHVDQIVTSVNVDTEARQ